MNLTMDDFGAIGDFASGLGVVVSLLYLARQMRQANHANVATTTNAVSSFFAGLLVQIGENRALCDALLRQGRGEPLDPVSRLQVTFVLRGQLVAFENYFNQYRLGFMDRSGWESRRGIVLDILSNAEARVMWDTVFSREQHPAFVREVNQALALRDNARTTTA